MHSQGNDFHWKMTNTETERQHKNIYIIQFIHTASEDTVKPVWMSEGETCTCAPVPCHSGKSSPFTEKWGSGGWCCYKWHVACAGVEGWHTRMWDDGAKLISRPVSPFQNDLVSFLQMRSKSKSKQQQQQKKQTNFNQPSQPQ